MKATRACVALLGLVGVSCWSRAVPAPSRQNNQVQEAPKPPSNKHLAYPSPPKMCAAQGPPLIHDGFNSVVDNLNCPENCEVTIHAPPLCDKVEYLNVNEVTPGDTLVSVGGYLFQGHKDQPCSLSKMDCCYSCNFYSRLVDFEDRDDWEDCRIMRFGDDEQKVQKMFSMDQGGKCCRLRNLLFKVIVTGKIQLVYNHHLVFHDVQSICRIP